MNISSLDGSPQVLALIDDLADCTDTKQVFTAATTRFNQLFGDDALAVKATTRLAFFPDYMQLVARLETISHSLRRNIVHDLKTPVTVIKGFAKTLLIPSVSNNPHQREEMLTGIVEQANRLVDDLNDILAPLNHKWEPQLEEFDLARLLKKVVMAEQHTERAQSHTLEVVGAEQPLMVTVACWKRTAGRCMPRRGWGRGARSRRRCRLRQNKSA